ncbi:O-antigen ligase family protein [Marilutibacter spongiae]|uniref:O-antigen ligase family protein n=1 Tax=Marilutibacter spongiae TaxID=2025720 RepID=A0A7W3TLM8_9GAMM|nr:O-antigen ligase family protein [Lysobacter spongiae]MBB1060612.1 O-antigen ligase family protein [Lysobacter spongiae]
MAFKRPDPSSPRTPAQRFPLAARAMLTQGIPAPPPSRDATAPRAMPKRTHRQNWPLYLFLFLLPLQNIQFGYIPNLGAGLNFLNVGFLASLAGAFFAGGRLARGASINRWVFAYMVYAIVSMFISASYVSENANHVAIVKDHLIGFSVLYLVQMSVQDWTTARRVVIAMMLPLPYIAKVAWLQHVSVASWHYSDDLRIPATFGLLGANEFAAFCVTVATVLFAFFLSARLSRIWKVALGIGIACMVMGVLYAYSRTAYVALILGLVTVILAWRGRWKMMLPLLLAAAILPAVLPSSVVERFDSTSVEETDRDESTEMRFVYWGIAWENFKSHPLTGTGIHSFQHREINPYGKDTHNLYIRTLSEGGVIGAVLLLGVLLSILLSARRELGVARSGTLHYALALGIVGAWMGLVCGNLFGDRFTHYPVIGYFWAFTALMLKARELPREENLP